jgi:hypothetical protein
VLAASLIVLIVIGVLVVLGHRQHPQLRVNTGPATSVRPFILPMSQIPKSHTPPPTYESGVPRPIRNTPASLALEASLRSSLRLGPDFKLYQAAGAPAWGLNVVLRSTTTTISVSQQVLTQPVAIPTNWGAATIYETDSAGNALIELNLPGEFQVMAATSKGEFLAFYAFSTADKAVLPAESQVLTFVLDTLKIPDDLQRHSDS